MPDEMADDGRALEDHAIIIAITQYPRLSRSSPGDANLNGIEGAWAVRDWLIESGRVRAENIEIIVRAVRDPDEADPDLSAVTKAFTNLYDRCWDEGGNPIIPFGRRLYVYVSGHGFAIDDDDGAVFCSEASPRAPWGVAAIKMLTAFRRGNFFRQFVLWIDACMDWEGVEPVQLPLRIVTDTREPPGPLFKGYAARPRLKTIEAAPDENGHIYGAFTRTLLDGLRGAAADPNGAITGESLKDYLYNTMAKHIPPEYVDRKDVDKQPFIRVDHGIVFATLDQRPKTAVVLRFGAGRDGAQARVWGRGRDSKNVEILSAQTIADGRVSVELPSGIYAVDVPDHGLRLGFEVTGAQAGRIAPAEAPVAQATPARSMTSMSSTEIAVDEAGDALTFHGDGRRAVSLSVSTSDPSGRIVVVDDRFVARRTGTGSLRLRLEPGLYKVRVQRGASSLGFTDRFVALNRDLAITVKPPPFVSPAPIAGSLVPEAHLVAGAWLDAVIHAAPGRGSKIGLLARYQDAPAGLHLPHPFDGLDLLRLDGTKVVPSLGRLGARLGPHEGGPLALCGIAVDPGVYVLQHRLAKGRRLAQTVVALAGWQTTLTLRRNVEEAAPIGAGPHFGRLGTLGMLMRPVGPDGAAAPASVGRSQSGTYDEDRLVETARQSLADGTVLLEGALDELLLRKFQTPLAGILGGLLLDLERERSGSAFTPERARLFDEVVGNLRRIVGEEHPDVEALSLRCVDPDLRRRRPLAAPPIYQRSWRILMRDAATPGDLIPFALWDRVRTNVVMPPYFAWTENAEARRAQLRSLSEAVNASQTHGRIIVEAAAELNSGEAAAFDLHASPDEEAVAGGSPRLAALDATEPSRRNSMRSSAIREEFVDHRVIAAAAGVPLEAIKTLLAEASSRAVRTGRSISGKVMRRKEKR